MPSHYVISLAETSSAGRLTAELEKIFKGQHPDADASFIGRLVGMVDDLFAGRNPGFCAIDMAYHDIGHTFQTALCLGRMFAGRAMAQEVNPFGPADFRRGLAAMLFHDTGYLKSIGDAEGTGAKYTFIHEQRSADLAASQLRALGWSEADLASVALFILCTGPSSRPDRLPFKNSVDAELGAMVCTADFIGQMSDPNYLKKLPALYREFEEAYDVRGIPHERRPFVSVDDLLAKTPAFWRDFVLPKLRDECRSVYRHLARPPGSDENPYVRAVEAHLASIVSGGRGGRAA